MIKDNDFINIKKKSDKHRHHTPEISEAAYYSKPHKIIAIILAILVTLAITRATFLGGSFLDSFVFGLFFGYMRYVFYAWVYYNLCNKLFNFYILKKFNDLNSILLMILFIGSAWIYAILYSIQKSPDYNFVNVWKHYGEYIKEAWVNVKGKSLGNYSDLPTGVVGAFIVSIFFAIPNSYGAQAVFWIFTIMLVLSYCGFFIFKDPSFFFNIMFISIIISYKYLAYFSKVTKWKYKTYRAKHSLNINEPTSNLHHEAKKWNFSDKKENDIPTYSEFTKETKQYFTTKVFSKYNEYKNIHNEIDNETNDKESLLDKTINLNGKENTSDDVNLIPQDTIPENSYWTEKIKKTIPSILNNIKRDPNSKANKNLNWKKVFYSFSSINQSNNSRLSQNEFNEFVEKKKSIINKTFVNFNINAEVVHTNVNSKIIQFEIKVNSNIKLSKINDLTDNFKYSLEEKYINILIPLENKSTIGIEITNPNFKITYFSDLYLSFVKHTNYLDNNNNYMILGQTLDGNVYSENLKNFTHLLIAGATGSGKSVELNNIILSLISLNSPRDVNLLLIDLKKIELTAYENIPHLVTPIIYDMENVRNAFDKIIDEMNKRYELFKLYSVKNIYEYNNKQKNIDLKLSRIIIIIDEYADLIIYDKGFIQKQLIKICQISRASGIHIILSTQRPSRDVITGLIKSNIPYQLALQCVSNVDSRIIIDQPGAEKLLKNGDMLFNSPSESSLIRLQSGFLNESLVNDVCNKLQDNYKQAYDFEFIKSDEFENFSRPYIKNIKLEIINLIKENPDINISELVETLQLPKIKIMKILAKYLNSSRLNPHIKKSIERILNYHKSGN